MNIIIKKEYLFPIILLIIGTILQAYNLFSYPYFLDDEGIYVSQAWAILEKGSLSPYTFFYDHAPLGWVQLASWAGLTGGFSTFGFSINSGRVFMLLLKILSIILIFFITKKLSQNAFASFIAALFYSISPITIYYGRWVLLDNIMVFWLLLSIFFIVKKSDNLFFYIVSALSFTISVLTKETAIFALPGMLFFIFSYSNKYNWIFSIALWISIFLLGFSYYPLYALLKSELFPYGSIFGGDTPHVSLFDSVFWQMSRSGGFIINELSQVRLSLLNWLKHDYLFFSLGLFVSVTVIFLSIFISKLRFFSIILIGFLYYFLRGGVILEFYVIPILPFFAISIGICVGWVLKKFSLKKERVIFLLLISIIIIFYSYYYYENNSLFTVNQTKQQITAVNYLSSITDSEQKIVSDTYAFVDFKKKNKNVDSFWKIDQDPAVSKKYHNSWKEIDYLLITPSVYFNMNNENLKLLKSGYNGSSKVMFYKNAKDWDIEIRKINK